MKLSLRPRSATTPLLLSAFCVVLSLPACAFLERADSEIERGTTAAGGSSTMTDTGGAPGTGGMEVAAAGGTDGTDTGGDGPGYNGTCPVEPCPGSENLIVNGDFSAGDSGWNGQNGTLDTSSGAGCILGPTEGDPARIGWDNTTGASLAPGTYTLSFDVTTDVTPTITARVGGIADPYPIYHEETFAAVSSGTQSFMFVEDEDLTVGVVFEVTNGSVCIDNVSMIQTM